MPDLHAALNDPSEYAVVYVLRQTMSVPWMSVVLTMITALLICSNVSYLTAVTRDLFAFARDGGFPFSDWIARVSRTWFCHWKQGIVCGIRSANSSILGPSKIAHSGERGDLNQHHLFYSVFDLYRKCCRILRYHIASNGCFATMLHVFHWINSLEVSQCRICHCCPTAVS